MKAPALAVGVGAADALEDGARLAMMLALGFATAAVPDGSARPAELSDALGVVEAETGLSTVTVAGGVAAE